MVKRSKCGEKASDKKGNLQKFSQTLVHLNLVKSAKEIIWYVCCERSDFMLFRISQIKHFKLFFYPCYKNELNNKSKLEKKNIPLSYEVEISLTEGTCRFW